MYEKYDDADKKSKHYEFFRKELVKVGVPAPRSTTKRAAANDDDDVEVAEVELDVICPISRVVMTNPVKKYVVVEVEVVVVFLFLVGQNILTSHHVELSVLTVDIRTVVRRPKSIIANR